MTIRDVIAYVDEIHDNDFSDALKCRWVSECEARIWSGIMLQPLAGFDNYEWQYDADRALLMPAPYDELYPAYLQAKIYLAYHEAQNYQNAMTAFNKLYDQASIWYAATYDPAHGGCMEIVALPTIVRGETAAVVFTLPYSGDRLSAMSAVLGSGGKTLLTLGMADMEIAGSEARFALNQVQSLSLPVGIMTVSIAGVDTDGQRFEAWPPLEIRVVETGVRGVIA